MKKSIAPKSSPLPDLFTMPNGEKFSSGWLSHAIWSKFKKPLDPEPFEVSVHDYVMCRVNQGPAFKAMVGALDRLVNWYGRMHEHKDRDMWEEARAALKLAREAGR